MQNAADDGVLDQLKSAYTEHLVQHGQDGAAPFKEILFMAISSSVGQFYDPGLESSPTHLPTKGQVMDLDTERAAVDVFMNYMHYVVATSANSGISSRCTIRTLTSHSGLGAKCRLPNSLAVRRQHIRRLSPGAHFNSVSISRAAKRGTTMLEHLRFSETTLTNDYRLQPSSELSLN
jgi:hypothetical protein